MSEPARVDFTNGETMDKLCRSLLREEFQKEGMAPYAKVFGSTARFNAPSEKAVVIRAMTRIFNMGVAIGRAEP